LISVKCQASQHDRIRQQCINRRKHGGNNLLHLVAIGLYFASDWILDRIESARGRQFENRSVIFFVIILVLAVVSFQILGRPLRS
jgi:hypothetical protein